MRGSALMTTGGLTKNDLIYNKNGKIVSKKLSYLSKMRGGANGAKIIPITRLIINCEGYNKGSLIPQLVDVYPRSKVIDDDKFIAIAKFGWIERSNNFINENILICDIGEIDNIPDAMDLNEWSRQNYFKNNSARKGKKDSTLTEYENNIIKLFNNKYDDIKLKLHIPGSGYIFQPYNNNNNLLGRLKNKYYLYICCDIEIQ